MNTTASQQNDNADGLFQKAVYASALATYQQVFLDGGKSADAATRVQVARALRGAALCYEKMGQINLAAQIVQTLAKRYGHDTDPRTRYWVELAQGATALPPPDEMTAAPEVGASSWDEFLKANDLENEPEPEYESNASSTSDSIPTNSLDDDLLNITPRPLKSEQPLIVIPEDEITLERLKLVFQNAFIECENDGEALRIQMEGARFLLHLDTKNKLIACAAIYALKEYGTPEGKNELANKLNRELILIRFVIHDETTFVAQYSLSYAQGLMPYHLVNALRLMQRVLTQSVAEYDTDDLLM